MDYGFISFSISSYLPLLILVFRIIFAVLTLFQLVNIKKDTDAGIELKYRNSLCALGKLLQEKLKKHYNCDGDIF